MKRSAVKVQRAHESSKKAPQGERTEKTASNAADLDGMPVKKIKTLCRKTIQVDIEFQKDVYRVQCDFDKAYNELFDKRRKLLQEHRNSGDNLSKFWLLVLKTFYSEFITERDEAILAYLNDIRYSCSPMDDLMCSNTIHFHFDKNPFFANEELTCTFYVNVAGVEGSCDELSYDGADMVSYEGCKIDWTPQNEHNNEESAPHLAKRNYQFSSFFDIFILPAMSNRVQTRMYAYIKACLCHHFEFGYYLKQRVIPKAILFFTGEIADLQKKDANLQKKDAKDSEAEPVVQADVGTQTPEQNDSNNCHDNVNCSSQPNTDKMDKFRGGKAMAQTGPKKNLDTKNTADLNLTEDEKPTVHELKMLYLETIKLDVELQHQIYNLEKSYEAKHAEIFNKRRKIIEEFKKKTSSGDVKNGDGDISQFWLRVLKASYTEFISKKDEQILAHLVDIRSQLFTEPTVKFTLTFFFEPNVFFSNRVLTKTYFLNCMPDVKDPLTYDGAEIYKCEGCTINWKPGHQPEKPTEKPHFQNVLSTYSTFFDFFSPPAMPDDTSDRNYGDVTAILQNDFELGFYLKERVIPKAILFYTGEIADCQSSDESTDESDDENDDNDEEVDSESSGNGAQF